MPLGLILGLGRSFRRKRTSSLDILTTKRVPRGFYKGKNCKPTGFHTRKGGYVIMQEKLPNYVVPDLTNFKLKPYVSQCPEEATSTNVSSCSSPPRYRTSTNNVLMKSRSLALIMRRREGGIILEENNKRKKKKEGFLSRLLNPRRNRKDEGLAHSRTMKERVITRLRTTAA
ncbi:hypothetical protein K7X08_002167 [Anisodus acutangulus]|uniref:Mitochondrial ribosomal protein L41 n=1 Tax=Anisodus acutangulus TaxID=402998 RepID=A0A9Q1LRC7_9SOLA|nr:hypothetical protein K7X08_002167 [Anisodus acutangulus]